MIHEQWYGDGKESEAVKYPSYFQNGIPLQTIALVSAAVSSFHFPVEAQIDDCLAPDPLCN